MSKSNDVSNIGPLRILKPIAEPRLFTSLAPMIFSIHGPYEIPKRGRLIDRSKESLRDFWGRVEDDSPGLAEGIGCYLFCMRAARGFKPMYVGMNAQQAFVGECFSPAKILIYQDAIAVRQGTPVLFLIARRTPQGKLTKKSPGKSNSLRLVETLLIGAALDKNPELANVQKAEFLRKIELPGLINTPRRPSTLAERELRKALSL